MKRALLGILLALVSSLSSVLSAPALADSSGTGCASGDPNHTGCVILDVTLSQDPTVDVIVHAHREAAAGADDEFDLRKLNATAYTSYNMVAYSMSDPGSPCGAFGGHDSNLTLFFDLTVKTTEGQLLGSANHIDICRDIRKSGNHLAVAITITAPAGGPGGGGGGTGPGGFNGRATAEISPGNVRGCPNSLLQFTGPIKKDFNTDANGNYTTGLVLPAGAYSVLATCQLGIGVMYKLTGNGTVKAGQFVTLNLQALVPGVSDVQPDPAPPVLCDAGSLTFLICGIVRTVVGVVDWVRDSILVPFLREQPLDKSDPQTAKIYALWAVMRNVASLFFIIIFMLVIFGTAIGWDNYTIKKILPRLIAAAILIPFSWYICAVVIDAGNILGAGLQAFMSDAIGTPAIDFTSNFSKLLLGGVLVAGAAGGYIALSSISAAVVLSAGIAIVGVFLTLVLRKIFITLLVVMSPWAFIAWILPNTRKWASKWWWQNLLRLTLMYVMIIGLFEAARLVAFFINFGPVFTPIAQMAVVVLPLFLISGTWAFSGPLMKMGQNALGKATGAAENKFGKSSDWAKQRKETRVGKESQIALDPTRSAWRRRIARRRTGFKGSRELRQLRMEAAAAKREQELGQSESIERLNQEMPQTSAERVANQTAAGWDKALSRKADEIAASEKNEHGVALKDIPLDTDGINYLKEKVRTGNPAMRIAAIRQLAKSYGGRAAVHSLRTGEKRLNADTTMAHDITAVRETTLTDGTVIPVGGTIAAGSEVRRGNYVVENAGEGEHTRAFNMGRRGWSRADFDRSNVAPEFQEVWDKGMKDAPGSDTKKPMLAASTDMSPSDVAKMDLSEVQRFVDYYERHLASATAARNAHAPGSADWIAANKKVQDVQRGVSQFNASFQAVVAPGSLLSMAPESVRYIAEAAQRGSVAVDPSSARLATERVRRTETPVRIVSSATSQQILTAVGGDLAQAAELQARIASEVQASPQRVSATRETLEDLVASGHTLTAADLGALAGGPTTMPAGIQNALRASLGDNLDQLAAVYRAYEADPNYRQEVHSALNNGLAPAPPLQL